MALKLRKRKDDPKEVQLLFDLHKLLNHNGRHWIKGMWYKHVKGIGMCYCLSGGVNKVAPTRTRLGETLNTKLRLLLGDAICRKTGGHSMVQFNDNPLTKWPDVENVIRESIKIGRG